MKLSQVRKKNPKLNYDNLKVKLKVLRVDSGKLQEGISN